MELLLKKKRVYKSKVSRLLSYGEAHQEMQGAEINIQIEKCKEMEKEGSDLFSQIAEVVTDNEYDQYEEEFNDVNIKLYTYRLKLVERNNSQEQHSTHVGNRTVNSGSDLKLPKIELPTFSGGYDKWMTFRDLFEASIHNNNKLSGAQKLQYLKSSLRDEAARVVQSIPITNDNYNEAWVLLNKRYQNVREIVTAHLDRLTNQPIVQSKIPQSLRALVDTTNECVRAIRVHNVPIEQWDVILVYTVTKLLDTTTRREWELAIKGEEFPSFQTLMEFLDVRAHALLIGTMNVTDAVQGKVGRGASVHHGAVQRACYYCEGGHSIYKCPEFEKLTVHKRQNEVKTRHLCFNCLKRDHQASQCSSSGCKKCKGRHNTLLHREYGQGVPKINSAVHTDVDSKQSSAATTTSNKVVKPSNGVTNHVSQQGCSGYVLLSTAEIYVRSKDNTWQTVRALLDSASQTSFITQSCLKKLGLKRHTAHVTISSLGGYDRMIPRGSVEVVCQSKVSKAASFTIQALVLTQISTLQPAHQVRCQNWVHLENLQLADPKYYQPGVIDILLGADIYGSLVEGGVCKGPEQSPTAIQTTLGWILIGHTGEASQHQVSTYHSQINLDAWIQQFWEVPRG